VVANREAANKLVASSRVVSRAARGVD
jgi:hypothetical protein